MNRIRKPKLLFKLLLFALPLLVLSIIVTSAILSWTSYDYFLKTIRQDYRNIIKSSAGEIRLFVENAQGGLKALALTIAATKIDAWQKEIALTAFNHAAVQFMSVALISPKGKAVASTGYEGMDLAVVNKSPVFHNALLGKSTISGVMFTKNNMPYVHLAEPVMRLGEVKEILWGVLNLKSVWDILERVNIGNTGRVSIMDLSGRLIGHREIDRVVKALPPERPDALIKIRRSDVPVEWIEQNDNSKIFCIGSYVPGLNWIIVLTQRYSEIYDYLYYNIYWAVLITCLVCLVAIVIGWDRVRRFLTPIYNLHQQVQRIGTGELDQKVSVESQDEVGDLARAFNEMTVSLKNFVQREVETASELVHAKNLAVLGATSSKVTHEVGNLLNNVGLVLPILKAEKLSSKATMALDMLEKDSARIRDFTHRFLQFAKKPDLHLKRQPMQGLVQEVLFIYERDAQARGITIRLDWPSDLPPVQVDSRFMYQVLGNLVKNSLEALKDTGIIDIKGMVDGNQLVMTIQDSGPGIAPDTLEQIFDPFFTTKGKKGTGLGLSIVKTIVEAHRGTIACRSEPGSGTAFVLGLPLH